LTIPRAKRQTRCGKIVKTIANPALGRKNSPFSEHILIDQVSKLGR
jgi:hypothetical protein